MASPMLLSALLVALVGVLSQAAPQPHGNASLPFVIQPRVQYDSTCRCGQKSTSRIVGGTTTGVNEWPWQAALMYGGRQQFCGGSLINDRYVLTAAHCTDGMRANELTIRLAEHNLNSGTETSHVDVSVSEIINHANYVAGDELNDIALIKLSSPVSVSDTVLPVCLPPPNPSYAGKTATVTGWGTTSSGGSSSNTLREVDVQVKSNSDCQGSYGTAIKDTMLCAGSAGKDSCQGDSGGPLVFKDGGGNYDQIGVVSWGYGCAAPNYPGVYTRVNKYLDWIKDNTQDGVYCMGMKL